MKTFVEKIIPGFNFTSQKSIPKSSSFLFSFKAELMSLLAILNGFKSFFYGILGYFRT